MKKQRSFMITYTCLGKDGKRHYGHHIFVSYNKRLTLTELHEAFNASTEIQSGCYAFEAVNVLRLQPMKERKSHGNDN